MNFFTHLATEPPATKRPNYQRRYAWFHTAILLGIALVLIATSCASGSSAEGDAAGNGSATEPTSRADEAPAQADSPTTDEEPAPTEGESASAAPAGTPAEQTLDWVVDLVNDPSADPDEAAARFAPEFLAVVPIEQVMSLMPQLRIAGDWSIESADLSELGGTAVLVATDGSKLNAELTVRAGEPPLIEGIRFTPRVEEVAIETTADFEAALAQVAPQTPAAIFEVINGECNAVIDLGADEVMPIGSIFKLWVLAELANQIEGGTASWDETIPVQDIHKSSPDGTFYMMEEGRQVTLWEFAAEMISVSDNTATDHLVYRLGRENVEAAIARSGVAEPERNIPMLVTSDLFRLKFDPTPPNSADYRALESDGRRALIDELATSAASWVGQEDVPVPVNADGVPSTMPRDHDLEWFATPLDLCKTHVHLAELAEMPGLEQVAEILATNADAGMPFDRSTWTNLRFKGGSEPGLVAAAWRMERNDGRVFVLAAGAENTEAPVSPQQALSVFAAGADLAAGVE